MAKKTFPDLIYVRQSGSGDEAYMEVHESVPAEGADWDKFAIYKRIGTGRSRLVPEVVEDGVPHKRVRVRMKP